MPEYLSPGVYVEEIQAGPESLEGVSTSTAGAVGVTERGPTEGRPVLVTSFAEFQRYFGGVLPEPRDHALLTRWGDRESGGVFWRFALSVKGFFDNGGQRLFVRRVIARGATAAMATLSQGLYVDLHRPARRDEDTLSLSRLSQIAGVNVGDSLVLLRTGAAVQPAMRRYKVKSYDAQLSTVTLEQPLEEDVSPGTWVVKVEPAGAPVSQGKASLTFSASARGQWGNQLEVRLRPMVSATLALLPHSRQAGESQPSSMLAAEARPGDTRLQVASSSGFSKGDTVLLQGQAFSLEAVEPGAPATLTLSAPLSAPLAGGTPVRRLRRVADSSAPRRLHVSNPSRLYEGALLEIDTGGPEPTKLLRQVQARSGEELTLDRPLPDSLDERAVARLIEARCEVRYQPEPSQLALLEAFEGLRLADDGSPDYLVRRINRDSRLVQAHADPQWAARQPELSSFPSAPGGGWATLGGGDDKLAELAPDDFIGEDHGPGQRTGIASLADVEEISLCMAPGLWSRDVQGALLAHCEALRYRFALLDAPQARLLGLQRVDPNLLKGPLDSRYAALYYPWLKGRDFASRQEVLLPPSAHVAGIYARTDVERGVHKAPANEVVRGISGLEVELSQREQDMLNPRGINALRSFPGRGLRVWGARTLSSESDWKYVNVRRLFIFVEASIDRGTQWAVFEPNDERLWQRVRLAIESFLESLWREGMLMGQKASEAFFVRCDRSTMAQNDIDNGRLICLVGIAPVKPAEFVIFRIQQKTLTEQS